jgi:hypothetical protein
MGTRSTPKSIHLASNLSVTVVQCRSQTSTGRQPPPRRLPPKGSSDACSQCARLSGCPSATRAPDEAVDVGPTADGPGDQQQVPRAAQRRQKLLQLRPPEVQHPSGAQPLLQALDRRTDRHMRWAERHRSAAMPTGRRQAVRRQTAPLMAPRRRRMRDKAARAERAARKSERVRRSGARTTAERLTTSCQRRRWSEAEPMRMQLKIATSGKRTDGQIPLPKKKSFKVKVSCVRCKASSIRQAPDGAPAVPLPS